MSKLFGVAAVVGMLLAAAAPALAQDGDKTPPKKADGAGDPQKQIEKLLEKFGGAGGIDLDQLKKLAEKFGGAGGAIDPEKIKKLVEKFGGAGGMDPDQLKKLMEKFGKGGLGKGGLGKGNKGGLAGADPEATFKKLDTDGDGKLTKKEFMKILELAKVADDQVDLIRGFLEQGYDRVDPEGTGITLEQFKGIVGQRKKKDGADKSK